MKVFLTDQSPNFNAYLNELAATPVMEFDRKTLKEKLTAISLPAKKLSALNADFLFSYRIFPSNIMVYKTQWDLERRNMRVGDTILQQVFIPPVRNISVKIVFGVRITTIVDEAHRKGFSYQTLQGHVEKGESIFTLEQAEGKLNFTIRTFSESGNLLTKMAAPFFSSPYQDYCTRRALDHVRSRWGIRI